MLPHAPPARNCATPPCESRAKRAPETDHGLFPKIQMVPPASLKPAKINDVVYKPVRDDDPSIKELAESIREFGVKVPLAATLDNVIVSGHRRRAAAILAG